MADRYTYLPLVGISVALVWLFADIGGRPAHSQRHHYNNHLRSVSLPRMAGIPAKPHIGKSSQSLFEHTLAVTDRNFTIHNNLGGVLNVKDYLTMQWSTTKSPVH